jgi:flagellar biosynthesis/type III secretory pathway chaperone
MAENIKELQELKVQNDEILKQQQAALDALDELQKEADQMRIYSKRG